jgi:hypothetical protein
MGPSPSPSNPENIKKPVPTVSLLPLAKKIQVYSLSLLLMKLQRKIASRKICIE